MKENVVEYRPRLMQMLEELDIIKSDNLRLQDAIFKRESRRTIKDSTTEVSRSLKESARSYGAKAERLADSILGEYSDGKANEDNIILKLESDLKKVNEEYDLIIDLILEDKKQFEKAEDDYAYKQWEITDIMHGSRKNKYVMMLRQHQMKLKRDIILATAQGKTNKAHKCIKELKELEEGYQILRIKDDIKEVEETRKEYQKAIKYCDEMVKKYHRRRKNEIKRLKEVAKGQEDPKEVVRRTVGSIINKLDGVNQFKNNVLATMRSRIDDFMAQNGNAIREEVGNGKKQLKARKKHLRARESEPIIYGIGFVDESMDITSEMGDNFDNERNNQIDILRPKHMKVRFGRTEIKEDSKIKPKPKHMKPKDDITQESEIDR